MRSKDLCRELAERLATPEGLRTARLLQMADLMETAASPPPTRPLPQPPEPIGIWEPRTVDGETVFVRPAPSPLGDQHAAAEVLRPKKSELPLRVCLFGESVAAGYLYAPHFTPARVLEEQLRAAGGQEKFEVVDLARTNETLPSLAATVRAALQINPDVLVLFVGNNWNLLETPEVSPYAPSVEARQRYARALRGEGVRGPARLARERLRQVAGETLDFIALLAGAVQIPVVVVLPEVNLADWENRQPPPWLPGDGTARWHVLYEEALDRLDQEDFAGTVAVTGLMQELDGGECPSTWRLQARAWTGLGHLDEARRVCRMEVETARYATQCFLGSPQATTTVRELLRDAARRHGFVAVDLREVFADPLPGRSLFLDYCHLTAEGIHRAMAAVAAEVLDLSGMLDARIDPRSLPAQVVPPEVEALARLGAAVHTAHRLLPVGSKAPILKHWCEAALAISPGIEQAMRDLLTARCSPLPSVLTAAQQSNLASPYRFLLQHGWRWDFLDAGLIEALCAVLPVREEVTRMLLAHHAIRPAGTDLTQPPYLWEPLERFYPEVMTFEDLPRRGTLRCPWPETGFCLVCDATRDVELEPTLRCPGAEGPVEVTVNGERVGSVAGEPGWNRTRLRIARASLRPGLNRLALHWPLPTVDGETALQAAVERLELGIAADLHPVLGELFSLIARPS